MTRATLRICFKVKRLKVRVTGRLTQTHNVCRIFRRVRPGNFKVGVRMEDKIDPRTLSRFGERAFAYAGPAAWNRLPDHIRRQSTPATFRRHLKTFLFTEVFNTT